MSLSIANTNYANMSAQAGLYQGTAAIASWLNGLAAGNSTNTDTPSASTASAAAPNVSAGHGPNVYNLFHSQISAAATAPGSETTSDPAQSESANASDYQQAVAAYADS
ncbi:MAG: hypothetical protein ACLPID_11480 [Beijerinckiaceae bacterium]